MSAIHRCESLLVGLSDLSDGGQNTPLDHLLSTVDCDVVVLRAPPGWELSNVHQILVPIAGRRGHDELRARLLGSLLRTAARQVTFLRVLPPDASPHACAKARRELDRLARDEARGHSETHVVQSASVADAITMEAAGCDLVILGLQRFSRRHKVFGAMTLNIARGTDCGLIMISRRG